MRVWMDSLRSTNSATSTLARDALVDAGGRTAVDALRADYARAPSTESRLAVIMAMATTGSADDIAFLISQLQGPFTGVSSTWPVAQTAATTLGLLRAQAARGALSATLARYGPSGFAGRAVAFALASLDRPPCADSIHGPGDPRDVLVSIVMRCGPQSMSERARYYDAARHGVWTFTNDAWQISSTSQPDTTTRYRVGEVAQLSPDARHATVSVSTWCGSLCGEGWTFRLLLTGGTWRVVSATMDWVS